MNTVQGFCDFNIPFRCSPTTTLREVVIRAVKRILVFLVVTNSFSCDILNFSWIWSHCDQHDNRRRCFNHDKEKKQQER